MKSTRHVAHENIDGSNQASCVIHDNLQIAPGLLVKKDMHVWTPITASHYHEDFFPEPEKFRPERFLKENLKDLDPITFRPFGGNIKSANYCFNTH